MIQLHWAINRAFEVLEKYDLWDTYVGLRQLRMICDNQDVYYTTFPFRGRIRERYVRTSDDIKVLTVDRRALGDTAMHKHLIAHGLGHHFLHQGNHCHLHTLYLDKQEIEAEQFAAVLLVPPGVLRSEDSWTPKKIALRCRVPTNVAARRFRIMERVGM
ncbi:MAG: ImmA/IrrE family metallo-endopeptidase [Peptococcaceae bacterium]|nr:ImmA/IrrE family metallo-endopeptidase [Peptococcaceae bacterium]